MLEKKITKEIKKSECFAQSYKAKQDHDNKVWVSQESLINFIKDKASYYVDKETGLVESELIKVSDLLEELKGEKE